MLILFQDLEDKKFNAADRTWERTLLLRTFGVSELPHFQTPHRRSMLYTVGVTADTLLEKVLRPMARIGMLELVGSDHFQFRSPAYRFIDLCIRYADEEWKSESEVQQGTFVDTVIDEQSASTWTNDADDEEDES